MKCALSLHLWLDAEHVGAIRARIAEMREPPLGLDAVPGRAARGAFEELLRAPARPSSWRLYAAARSRSSPLRRPLSCSTRSSTHPTRRLLRTSSVSSEEMLELGAAALAAVASGDGRGDAVPSGSQRTSAATSRPPAASAGRVSDSGRQRRCPRRAGTVRRSRWMPSRAATRDSSIRSTRRRRSTSTASDESLPTDERAWALAYKRLREMDVPEWMAPIIFKTREQAVGVLPRPVAAAVGRGAPRDDGRGLARLARRPVLRHIRSTGRPRSR